MPLKIGSIHIIFKSYWLYYYYLILFPIEWTEFLDRAFRSIIPTILGEPNDNRTCLDIGCGPSISNVISGRSKIQIYFFILQSEKKSIFFGVPLQLWFTNYCLLVETLKINFSIQNVFLLPIVK